MRIQILQHSETDPPALVENWVNSRKHTAKITHLYKGEVPQDPNAFDFLIILGGAVNVDQESEFPWLKSEKKFIESCLKVNKTALGICLGGQLIAEVLGARVKKNSHWEVGWHPVQMIDSSPFTKNWAKEINFFHYHEYTFDLPQGAKHLATSEACANQAYSYGKNVFGTQFHPEVNEAWVHEALEPPYVKPGKYVQKPDDVRAKLSLIQHNQPYFFGLLDELSATV